MASATIEEVLRIVGEQHVELCVLRRESDALHSRIAELEAPNYPDHHYLDPDTARRSIPYDEFDTASDGLVGMSE